MILHWTYFISVIYIEISNIFLEEKTDSQIYYSKKLLTSKHKRREVVGQEFCYLDSTVDVGV